MTLTSDSIDWAIEFVARHSDGDLFPQVAEMSAILDKKQDFVKLLAGKPLSDMPPGAHRRFIVPKDEISYRQATQLDPQDTIILSAILYQFGVSIESRRMPKNVVFSYRFDPDLNHGLYGSQSGWNLFWTSAFLRSRQAKTIIYCDIADFYNQISHHALENQLLACNLPNQAIRWIISLLASTTAGVSRGIPIGPHAAHLLAEITLVPIDNSMSQSGMSFIRYADDILIFTESEQGARRSLARLATILDKQQRLTMQRYKTRLFEPSKFQVYCSEMIEDRPINQQKDQVLKVISKYSKGNPYRTVSYNHIGPEDWQKLSGTLIRQIIEEYLQKEEKDFIRLRWFYRRLAQIGHPGAIDVTLENLDAMAPCFASICAYLASLQTISHDQWLSLGNKLLDLFESDLVQDNEYFRLSIVSLFTKNSFINHFNKLANIFAASDPFAKREILLAAKKNSAVDWIREQKENFEGMDQWQRTAFLYGLCDFPIDERRHFLSHRKFVRPFEEVLALWIKQKT